MQKNVNEMAEGVELGEKLLDGAKQMDEEAHMFSKNTKDVNKAAIAASFWACSKPCLIIFGLLTLILLYFFFK